MARPKDNKKKSNDYRGGAALLKKQQEANTKKYKAMTPAQKKAYITKQAKAIGKTTAQVASMVGGVGIARAAGRKVVGKALARNLRNSPKGAPNVPTPKGGKLRETYYKSRTKASKARERGGIYNDGEGSFLNNSKMVARGPKNSKDLAKMKKALVNNVNSKNLKGKLGTTRASQPSRPIDRNIARGYVLRKKFPNKFKP
jgi:hypothetical protein